MPYQTLTCEVRNAVAYVTFNTPESLNSITEDRLTDLAGMMDQIEGDISLKAVAITGVGKAFCVGLDLGLLKKAFADVEYFRTVITRLNSIIMRMEQLPIPVVSAVNGYARAGGFEIALGSDIMLIADEAKIGDNHTQVAVMPGGGSTQRLPRKIGDQKAKELIWTARWLTGKEAVDYGLALRSVPLSELPTALEELLDQFRDKERAVLAVVKRTMNEGRDLPLADAVGVEIENFVQYTRDEPYAREGFFASIEGMS